MAIEWVSPNRKLFEWWLFEYIVILNSLYQWLYKRLSTLIIEGGRGPSSSALQHGSQPNKGLLRLPGYLPHSQSAWDEREGRKGSNWWGRSWMGIPSLLIRMIPRILLQSFFQQQGFLAWSCATFQLLPSFKALSQAFFCIKQSRFSFERVIGFWWGACIWRIASGGGFCTGRRFLCLQTWRVCHRSPFICVKSCFTSSFS